MYLPINSLAIGSARSMRRTRRMAAMPNVQSRGATLHPTSRIGFPLKIGSICPVCNVRPKPVG